MSDISYKDKLKNRDLNDFNFTDEEIEEIEHERAKPEGQE